MKAVFNSSPFIFLSGLDLADLALGLFTDVCIPVHVREEILRKLRKTLGSGLHISQTGVSSKTLVKADMEWDGTMA